MDPRDALILSLCEKLYICSRLLTRAAEKLEWDRAEVQELICELRVSVALSQAEYLNEVERRHASIQAPNNDE